MGIFVCSRRPLDLEARRLNAHRAVASPRSQLRRGRGYTGSSAETQARRRQPQCRPPSSEARVTAVVRAAMQGGVIEMVGVSSHEIFPRRRIDRIAPEQTTPCVAPGRESSIGRNERSCTDIVSGADIRQMGHGGGADAPRRCACLDFDCLG